VLPFLVGLTKLSPPTIGHPAIPCNLLFISREVKINLLPVLGGPFWDLSAVVGI